MNYKNLPLTIAIAFNFMGCNASGTNSQNSSGRSFLPIASCLSLAAFNLGYAYYLIKKPAPRYEEKEIKMREQLAAKSMQESDISKEIAEEIGLKTERYTTKQMEKSIPYIATGALLLGCVGLDWWLKPLPVGPEISWPERIGFNQ